MKKKNEPTVVAIPETMKLDNSDEVYNLFIDLINNEKTSFEIDLSPCEMMDQCGVQIFASFLKETLRKKIDVKIIGPLHPNLSQRLEDGNFLTNSNKQILFSQLKKGGFEIEQQ